MVYHVFIDNKNSRTRTFYELQKYYAAHKDVLSLVLTKLGELGEIRNHVKIVKKISKEFPIVQQPILPIEFNEDDHPLFFIWYTFEVFCQLVSRGKRELACEALDHFGQSCSTDMFIEYIILKEDPSLILGLLRFWNELKNEQKVCVRKTRSKRESDYWIENFNNFVETMFIKAKYNVSTDVRVFLQEKMFTQETMTLFSDLLDMCNHRPKESHYPGHFDYKVELPFDLQEVLHKTQLRNVRKDTEYLVCKIVLEEKICIDIIEHVVKRYLF